MTWSARLKTPLQDQRGSGLLESIVAVAIAGIAVVAFVVALSTGSIAVGVRDRQVVAQSLAQSQLEHIFGLPYNPAAYPHVYIYHTSHNPNPITLPEGYAISVEVGSIPGACPNIQKITVTISRDGEDILAIETYRMNR